MRLRRDTIDPNVRGTYLCTSICVRGAGLLAGDHDGARVDRRGWLEKRLAVLAGIFAVDINTFTIEETAMHLVVSNRPDITATWTPEEVARRWLRYLPPTIGRTGRKREVTDADIRALVEDDTALEACRKRLSSISELHKALKEPLAKLVNRLERTRGHFWGQRFRCLPALDECARLMAMVATDLRPVRSGAADRPERCRHAAIRHRIEARRTAVARLSRAAGARRWIRSGPLTDGFRFPQEPTPSFLAPIERTPDGRGLLAHHTLDAYLAIVDAASRLHRGPGAASASIPATLDPILQRSGMDCALLTMLLSPAQKWIGSVLGGRDACTREATRLGCREVKSALKFEPP